MKKRELYPNPVSTGLTDRAMDFLKEKAPLFGWRKYAEAVRQIVENSVRDEELLMKVMAKGFSDYDAQNEVNMLENWKFLEPVEEQKPEKKKRKLRVVKDSGVIYIMSLPNLPKKERLIAITNLKAFCDKWYSDNEELLKKYHKDNKAFHESIRQDYRTKPKKKHGKASQRKRRKYQPHIRCTIKPILGSDGALWMNLLEQAQPFGRRLYPLDDEHSQLNPIHDDETCPDCGRNMMVLGKGKHGDFLGCVFYPGCRGSLNAEKIDDDKMNAEFGIDPAVEEEVNEIVEEAESEEPPKKLSPDDSYLNQLNYLDDPDVVVGG